MSLISASRELLNLRMGLETSKLVAGIRSDSLGAPILAVGFRGDGGF